MESDTIETRPTSFLQLNHIEPFVIDEFKQRGENIGFDYKKNSEPGYKGPRSSWIRVCSNAQDNQEGLFGFIMYGVNGFDDTYGFNSPKKRTDQDGTILGYDVFGNAHRNLKGSFEHRPSPGINGIESELLGGNGGKFNKTIIKWNCWSSDQLDYMEKYFMVPGMSVIIEWGWNNYNPASLFDLQRPGGIPTKWGKTEQNGEQKFEAAKDRSIMSAAGSDAVTSYLIKKSNGNWNFSFGRIVDYSYQLREDGGYDVTTTVSNPGSMIEALSSKNSVVTQGTPGKLKEGIIEYADNTITRIIEFCEHPDVPNFINSGVVETRAFYADPSLPKAINDYELFKANASATWMSMGLVVDVVNYYYAKYDKQSTTDHFRFVISDSIICAHANLKSSDANVLLIPNSLAPTGFSTNQAKSISIIPNILNSSKIFIGESRKARKDILEEFGDVLSEEGKEKKDPAFLFANEALKKNKRDTNRINLASIICKKRLRWEGHNTISFPNYNKFPSGNAGYLKDLYINTEIVRNAFKTNDQIKSAMMQILNAASKAAGEIWDFEIRPTTTNGNGFSYLTITDNNYIGEKNVDDLLKEKELYKFHLTEFGGIVKNAAFTVKPEARIAMQTMAQASTNEQIAITQKKYIRYERIDRIFGDLTQKEENMQAMKNGSISRTLIDPKFAIVRSPRQTDNGGIFFDGTPTDAKLIRLCEPDESVLKASITDNDPHNNAIFNGLMPNIELTLTIQGIAGIRFMDCFSIIDGLPERYRLNAIFQVKNVKHVVQDGNWDTIIIAGVRPSGNFEEDKKI